MPIRHTEKGWYWGSKGPFKTKKKALSVQGAAYASGYKAESLEKESLMKIIEEVLEEFLEERDYKKEAERLRQTDPNAREKHAARNRSRRKAEKDGVAKKGDGNDVHHPEGYFDDAKTIVEPSSKNRGRKEKSRIKGYKK
tara:strand:+ start:730 stop:1149 length:420 start_codon:yes stop_codon:yes gene_type:complete